MARTKAPAEPEYTEVKDYEGLWDEDSEAKTYHINRRSLCLKHDFVNASLHWEGQEIVKDGAVGGWYVSLEGEHWGKGYGAIRLCRKCKHIDCIHAWEETKTYRLYHHKYFYTAIVVSKCKICGRRIRTGGCGCYQGTKEAVEMISRIAKEFGYLYKGNPTQDGFGSNYYTVLPAETARRMDESKENAERYVRETFRQGGLW